ncbi:MAG TPA: cyclopropane-fatty-acyl-phospholipid synthase family protein [Gaiellaceae bacterium]|nr:cyclopropane-fatty-acyl-phospholipid synthase family protein [Gaiellaceae bacterium]
MSVRAEPAPGRTRVLGGLAVAVLERALAQLEGGTLEVTLPDGTSRRFGSGEPVRLEIHDSAFFRRLATRGKLGLGESYTAGEWDSDDLPRLFELLLGNAEAAAERHARIRRLQELRPRLNRRNGLTRARRNIAYHYDLGNELFALMLDETMTYSCAIFATPETTLADAQREKYRRLSDTLSLGPEDHVLEIGCGWGGFARFAAQNYGCRVTALTISAEQAVVARERTAGLPVEIREQDYRTIEGEFSKVVSIEMLEAIGADQFGTYFATIDRVLAPGGRAAVQTILVPDQRWERYRRTPDWIERYVFPGCLIPSLESLTRAAARDSALGIYGVEEIGEHYAETLRRWRANFHERIADVRALGYDRRFERTWDFYLAFCEAAFRTRALRDVQLVLERPGARA